MGFREVYGLGLWDSRFRGLGLGFRGLGPGGLGVGVYCLGIVAYSLPEGWLLQIL